MSAAAELLRLEQSYAEAAERLPGGRRLRADRERALRAFLSSGFPTTRSEAWKYTDLRALKRRVFALAVPAAGRPAGLAELAFADLDAVRLTFADGHLVAALSAPLRRDDGLIVDGLAHWLAERPELLAEPLLEPLDGERFTLLNAAFAADGALIRVPAGVELEQPVYLLFCSLDGEEASVCHPRVRIELGRSARATVIEHYVGRGQAENLTNAVTEIDCAAGARLVHYRIQAEAAGSFHIGALLSRQQADSRLTSHNLALGGKLARCDLRFELAGPGAELELNGLYLAGGRQHIDNHTRIDHREPHTRSLEDYRGVVDGHGRAVFNGKVVVHPQAQKIEAHQSNRNLVLAETAEVDTKPELEIYADDVKCTHGATVGQLDRNALFYLLSRGIDDATARALLTFAFADDIIARLALAPIRRRLERIVLERLPDSARLEEFV